MLGCRSGAARAQLGVCIHDSPHLQAGETTLIPEVLKDSSRITVMLQQSGRFSGFFALLTRRSDLCVVELF